MSLPALSDNSLSFIVRPSFEIEPSVIVGSVEVFSVVIFWVGIISVVVLSAAVEVSRVLFSVVSVLIDSLGCCSLFPSIFSSVVFSDLNQ